MTRGLRGVAWLAAIASCVVVSRGTAQVLGAPSDLPSEGPRKTVTTPDLDFPTVVPGAVDPDRYTVGPGDLFQLNLSEIGRAHV